MEGRDGGRLVKTIYLVYSSMNFNPYKMCATITTIRIQNRCINPTTFLMIRRFIVSLPITPGNHQ